MQLMVGPFNVSIFLLAALNKIVLQSSHSFFNSKISCEVQKAVSDDSVRQVQEYINFLIQEKSAFRGFSIPPLCLYPAALVSFKEDTSDSREIFLQPQRQMQKSQNAL